MPDGVNGDGVNGDGVNRDSSGLGGLNRGVIKNGEDYINSLRGRKLEVYFQGERIEEPVDHPLVRPSINAVAATYDLAVESPELASATSQLTGERVNRFLHVAGSADDLVKQNKMQRELGRRTGTCFQRCVGMDAINALHSVTFDLQKSTEIDYHDRFLSFVARLQKGNLVLGGAMTDPKGDRSLPPHQQHDPDLYLRVVERRKDGVVIRGAKAHQTGCLNSHWLVVMPTGRLSEADRDYAISGAVPVDAPGITYIYGRQSCDTRSLEGGDIDVGNAKFGGQEAMVIFDDVFIPNEFVFMNGEYEQAATLVERFTCYHRRSYVCKTGLGDVLIGAAARLAEVNGASAASHIKDKLVEMNHLNETIYGAGIAASYEGKPLESGVYIADDMLANVCKHNVTRHPFEIARLAQDIAGGYVSTLPSEQDFRSKKLGPTLRKYLATRKGFDVEERVRLLRLVENLTMGRNAVGYLTESMHGAGSPQAQRIQMARKMGLEEKKLLALRLSGVKKT